MWAVGCGLLSSLKHRTTVVRTLTTVKKTKPKLWCKVKLNDDCVRPTKEKFIPPL
jgi:hypothetical protein